MSPFVNVLNKSLIEAWVRYLLLSSCVQQGLKGKEPPTLAPGGEILILLTIIFCPGVGVLIIFFRKCQNHHHMPDPLSGLTLIGELCIVQIETSTSPSGVLRAFDTFVVPVGTCHKVPLQSFS